jgi:hypothetical protein
MFEDPATEGATGTGSVMGFGGLVKDWHTVITGTGINVFGQGDSLFYLPKKYSRLYV